MSRGFREDGLRGSRFRTCFRRHELDVDARTNLATANHGGVERQLAAESLDDAGQDLTVLFEGVGVERGHHAPAAQVLEADNDVANPPASDVSEPSRPVPEHERSDHREDQAAPPLRDRAARRPSTSPGIARSPQRASTCLLANRVLKNASDMADTLWRMAETRCFIHQA